MVTRISDAHKTDRMLLLELEFSEDIMDLLSHGTVREVGKRLGIDFSTVAKWRHRLNIPIR